MKKWLQPISHRLTLVYTLIVAVLLGGFALTISFWMRSATLGGITRSVQADLSTAALQWQAESTLHLATDGAALQVLDAHGQVAAFTGSWPRGVDLPGSAAPAGLLPSVPGDDAVYATGSITLPNGYRVVTALEVSDAMQRLADLWQILAWVTVGGIVLAAGAGYLMARLALRPVEGMARTAYRIGQAVREGGLASRMPLPDAQDELHRLARAFNDMLDRVQAAFAAQSRFVSDASHELRTPVTVISGYANLLRRWGRSDPQVLDEAVDVIAKESERMTALLGDLLLIARGEQVQVRREPVELTPLLAEVGREGEVLAAKHGGSRTAHPVTADQGVVIRVDCPDILVALADEDYLKQALLALVDNAVRHTPAGGRVTLRARWAEQRNAAPAVEIWVEDTGGGIPPEHLPHIVERFYRVDADRNRATGGAGLGLAIAHWLVELQGGSMEVASQVGQGTTFRIRLPAA